MPLLLVIYLAFIGLGLPDSLLGSAWPAMHGDLGAAVSLGGFVSMTTCSCTILSSLFCGRLMRRLGTGRLVLASVALTAVAIFGYSTCTRFWQLIAWAIPYGLGAGAVDAALNAYAAIHYEARHMNWLHCMWGIGSSAGPVIMSQMVLSAAGWRGGYHVVGAFQLLITACLVLSLRLWDTRGAQADSPAAGDGPRGLALLGIPGVWQALLGFFCYCALESTSGLWAATYMVLARGASADLAALFAGLFYIGLTLGRLVSGFLTLRLSGQQLQHLGELIAAAGVVLLVLAPGELLSGSGLFLLGLGCSPIYPQMIHLTPERFGEENATSLMGVQMAVAYVGSLAVPPLVGLLIGHVSPWAFPVAALVLVAAMTACLMSCDRVTGSARL
ncbi:MAG: MFS transporter [Atopobiaceae bacterium]|nr:MFS transporter [Atopobiaceae bacterium]